MTNTSTVVILPPGKLAPQAALKELITNYPTNYGFGIQYEGNLVLENHSSSPKLEDIEVLLGEQTKEGWRVLQLGNWLKTPDQADVPPYSMVTSEDSPFLGIFIDGDLPDYEGDGHVAEYNMSKDFLFPMLDHNLEKVGVGEYEAFYTLLREEKFQKMAKKAFGHRGVFCFLPKNGEPIVFGNNEIAGEYSWGLVTNAHGLNYKEKADTPAPEPKKEEPKKATSFLGQLLGGGKKADTPAPVVANKTEPKPAGTVTEIPLVFIKCPNNLDGGAKNFWLRTFNAKEPGQLPGDHQSKDVGVWVHPAQQEFAKRQVKNTKELRNLVDEMKKGNVVSINKEGPTGTQKSEPKESKESKSSVREPASNYIGTSTVLDPKDKEFCMNVVTEFLDKKKSPLEIQKEENKFPVFSDEIGGDFNDLLFVTTDGWMKMFDGNKKAVAALLQFKRRYIEASGLKLEDLIQSGSAGKDSAKGDEPKEVNTEKVNDQTGKAAPASANKPGGMLSFLSKSAA